MKNKVKITEIKGLFFYCRPHLIVNQARQRGAAEEKPEKKTEENVSIGVNCCQCCSLNKKQRNVKKKTTTEVFPSRETAEHIVFTAGNPDAPSANVAEHRC